MHFEFQVSSPWTKLRECCQNVLWQNRVCEFWLFPSLKSYAFFSQAVLFFSFSNFILSKKNNKRMCQKSETQFLRSMCEQTDAVLIVSCYLNLVGVELDLWVCVALWTHSHFRNMVIFYRFKQVGS